MPIIRRVAAATRTESANGGAFRDCRLRARVRVLRVAEPDAGAVVRLVRRVREAHLEAAEVVAHRRRGHLEKHGEWKSVTRKPRMTLSYAYKAFKHM